MALHRCGSLLAVIVVCLFAGGAQAVNLLVDSGFEAGPVNTLPPPWANVGMGPSWLPMVEGNAATMYGSLSLQHVSWTGTADEGFVYQQVSVAPGLPMDASITIRAHSGGAESGVHHFHGVGIDPTGGTDWNGANVVKYVLNGQKNIHPNWITISVNGVVAQSNTVTYFIYSYMDTANGGWWAHMYDNAVLTPEPSALALLGLAGLPLLRRRR